MSVTVVTVRDDNGAPSGREAYADGVRYTTRGGDLEVFSVTLQPLALYPSGNWLSVYMDDSVVVAAGPPQYIPTGEPQYAASPPLYTGPTAAEAVIAPGADDASEARHSDSVSPAEPGSVRDAPTRAPAAKPDVPPALPPGMRAVVFRPRPYQTPPDDERPAERRHSQLRPVAIRPRATPPTKQDDPAPEAGPRLRPVAFRGRTYREPEPEADPSDDPPEGDDSTGDQPAD
jgi:hypothetical protein